MKEKVFWCNILVIVVSFVLQYAWFYHHVSPWELVTWPFSGQTNATWLWTDTTRDDQESEQNVEQGSLNIRQSGESTEISEAEAKSNNIGTTATGMSIDNIVGDVYAQIQASLEMFLQQRPELVRNKEFNDRHFWHVVFNILALHPTQYFRDHIWQQRPLLLRLQTIHRDVMSFIGRQQSANSREWTLLNTDLVLETMETNDFYENPYMLFVDGKLKTPVLTSPQYRQQKQQRRFDRQSLAKKLKLSTLVVNNAGIILHNISFCESILMRAFRIPVNTNVYVSKARDHPSVTKLSSSVHNDRQDIFILQAQVCMCVCVCVCYLFLCVIYVYVYNIYTYTYITYIIYIYIYVYATKGNKRWQVWSSPIIQPRFEQIRGKDNDVVTMNELANQTLYYDEILQPFDVLYIPRGFYIRSRPCLRRHTPMPKIPPFTCRLAWNWTLWASPLNPFCFVVLALLSPIKIQRLYLFLKDGQKKWTNQMNGPDLDERVGQQSTLTYLSGYLWRWSFDQAELRRTFPIGFVDYHTKLWTKVQNAHSSSPNAANSAADNADTKDQDTDETAMKEKAFFNEMLRLIEEFRAVVDKAKKKTEEEKLLLYVPNVNEEHLKKAYHIFQKGLIDIIQVFASRGQFVDNLEYKDPIDRNEKFDDQMFEKIMNIFVTCGVPISVVNDGKQ
ncbi:hypothetical protein RFI_12100 [Reticulomyxa filosa]|uniref:JmjC domain-containing protein n=1 Tax=Reticulomyxa filosa TaxID=46433 RepID=X6NH37_RETFI|nr:hypothetical protein RFI_12100 [Reticulomyxa filosa]|eukprot:ETO25044.1 hypothetical protein RFI_12100 [Reticulomyxa filosa]